jgi:hypothetical protein
MSAFSIKAHRAPDPAPVEEPPTDPFEPADPHQPPIRTPMNDEPVPNPSIASTPAHYPILTLARIFRLIRCFQTRRCMKLKFPGLAMRLLGLAAPAGD